MTTDGAQSAVSLSAFTVASVYAYRKLTEPQGIKGVPETAHFVLGFGFVYIILALIAQGAPDLGGMLAILVAVGDLLVNGGGLVSDLTGALKATTSKGK